MEQSVFKRLIKILLRFALDYTDDMISQIQTLKHSKPCNLTSPAPHPVPTKKHINDKTIFLN
jgi:hypothetical protein